MSSIGIRDLKNSLSRVIRRVAAGETVDVTDRGRVVARIAPAGPNTAAGPDRFAMLVAAGIVRPPAEIGSLVAGGPKTRKLGIALGLAAELIDEDRGE